MKAFVTVGTTRFDDLICNVLRAECLESLKKAGITSLLLQVGASDLNLVQNDDFKQRSQDEGSFSSHDIGIRYYRYKPSIQQDILDVDLIIGHAGAGTVLECMRLRKPLIVVINEKLMDNHQSELAVALADRNHVLYCVPEILQERILDPNLFKLVPYNPPDQRKVASFINKKLGVGDKQQ